MIGREAKRAIGKVSGAEALAWIRRAIETDLEPALARARLDVVKLLALHHLDLCESLEYTAEPLASIAHALAMVDDVAQDIVCEVNELGRSEKGGAS